MTSSNQSDQKPNLESNLDSILAYLADVVDSRRADLASGKIDGGSSYIAQLFTKGDDAILKKIGEEATETVMAAKDSRQNQLDPKYQQLLVGEMADLWFHCLVALSRFNLRPEDVLAELKSREGRSGITEKASRKT
jgi:phosphoribosyl-ATP pyrophosphohydrolase